ncbi:MAG: hypothetical protein A2Z20_10655 [Bdellovibrionales bacterium RBG_16_40_8]|nr:MAG: hypothetical protein A2Z20_10655 [Bdellovibrionales bacterium RBG_16_40_8]
MATQVGGTRRYDGPMGKSERAFVVGLIGLLLGFEIEVVRNFADLIFIAMSLLTLITILNRIKNSLSEKKNDV